MNASSFTRNVIANYLGQGWSAVMNIAFVPLYIRFLGIEAYGLIGVYAMLQAWMSLLDMGLTPALNREMARLSAGARDAESLRDLLRSMEYIFFGIGCAVAVVFIVCAGWLARDWLNIGTLPLQQAKEAIRIVGLVLATRLCEQVYRGSLLGLQHQVALNVLQAGISTLRSVGAVVVLAFFVRTIQAFFFWQLFVSVVSVLTLGLQTYYWLPSASRPARFSGMVLGQVRNFAGGVLVTLLMATLLTQADKVILSKMLSLKNFGYYALASTVSGGLYQIIYPMSSALFPRLSSHVAAGDETALIQTYRKACQWMSAITVPPALVVAFFPYSLVLLWTGDSKLATAVAPIIPPLIVGTLLNGFLNTPYALQLAFGKSGLGARVNTVAVCFQIPALLIAVHYAGALGAAWVWVALNVGYMTFGMHYMHTHILPPEKWVWYKQSVIAPLAIGAMSTALLAFLLPTSKDRFLIALLLIFAGIVVSSLLIAVLPAPRIFALAAFSKGKKLAGIA